METFNITVRQTKYICSKHQAALLVEQTILLQVKYFKHHTNEQGTHNSHFHSDKRLLWAGRPGICCRWWKGPHLNPAPPPDLLLTTVWPSFVSWWMCASSCNCWYILCYIIFHLWVILAVVIHTAYIFAKVFVVFFVSIKFQPQLI